MRTLYPIAVTIMALVSPWIAAQPKGQAVDKSLEIDARSRVFIDVPRGDVFIGGWRQSNAKVSGYLDSKSERFVFERDGQELFIKVKLPQKYHRDYDADASNLKIMLPVNSQVTVNGVTTDITATQLENEIEINTLSGDIKLSEVKDHITAETISGDIDLKDVSGKIKLRSVSGDIRDANSLGVMSVNLISGDFESVSQVSHMTLNSVSGDCNVKFSHPVQELEMKSVSGEIEVELELANAGTIRGSSVSGDIQLNFNKIPDAEFSLSTSAGGSILNGISDHKPSSKMFVPRETLEFSLGKGLSSVDVSTVSGNIELVEN